MGRKRIRHGVKDLFSGDFITKMKLDRQIGYVFFLFWLVAGFIVWNLYVESELIKISDNEKEMEVLKIRRDQTTLQLLKLNHKDIVQELLIKNHSTLSEPQEPAILIERNK